MKMLVTRTAIGSALPFVLSDLKAHSRVTSDDENSLIISMGRMAVSEIEHFAQIALLNQTIRVNIFDPTPDAYGLNLPVGPVADLTPITVTIDGAAFTHFEFCGGNRPHIRWLSSWYELMPKRLTIEYQAGFGADADTIPPDLTQAIMDQAALLYDARGAIDEKTMTTSQHMARIGARYRGVSL
jgi:uncharacterized phiE125 gp8 family phage protein